MILARTLAVALLGFGLAWATPMSRSTRRSPEPARKDGKYFVSPHVAFDNHASWTFLGDSLPEGLKISDYQVQDTHVFVPDNVAVHHGYLELLVGGGQTAMPYKCSEVVTDVDNIKYASVRTVAIFSEPAGVCNGIFFYESDSQETDIEWLSDRYSRSNKGIRRLWLTNQDADLDGKKTSRNIYPPALATRLEHEYRIDWTEGRVQWFLDGLQVWEATTDVPSVPGPWVFNNWSNGDKDWSAGPPARDAVFRIRSIDMYYNTA